MKQAVDSTPPEVAQEMEEYEVMMKLPDEMPTASLDGTYVQCVGCGKHSYHVRTMNCASSGAYPFGKKG